MPPRCLQEASRCLQDGPRGLQDGSKRPIRLLSDMILVHFGKAHGDKLVPKLHPDPTLCERTVKPRNYYFCNTRGVFHVFDVPKNLHKIQEESVTKCDPSKKGTDISPRCPKMPPRDPKMPQDDSKSLPRTPPRRPKTF